MEADDTTLGAIAVMMAGYHLLQKVKRRKRWGVRPIYQQRKELGHYFTLIPRLRQEDEEMHFVYFRMGAERFDKLLSFVGPKLLRCSHNEPLSPGHKLALTLRYLATGMSMTAITFEYFVAKQTVGKVISEVCEAVWSCLHTTYMPVPQTNDWKHISSDFYNLWDMPNCIGVVDGKHVRIVKPNNSGSDYFNYKHYFSMVLLAVCDARRCFTIIDVGCNGRVSDGGVLSNSEFGHKLQNGGLNLPECAEIPETNVRFPHYFVADEAFPLSLNMLRPYPGKNMPVAERVFNYRLSRARILIENAFGVLAARWRILHSPINAKLEKVELIIKAVCIIHNFIMKEDASVLPGARQYCPAALLDRETHNGAIVPGEWRQQVNGVGALEQIGQLGAHNYTRDAAASRALLKMYLVSRKGSLPWQLDYVNRGTH